MLLAAASAPAMAQGNMGNMGGGAMDPAAMVQRSTDRLMAGITLSATQSDSVKAINARFVTDAKAAMGGSDMRAKMTELRTKQRADLRAQLTPDQQAIFDKNVASMPARTPRPQP
jgi:Spy/CpxP family protein refolding chaperone